MSDSFLNVSLTTGWLPITLACLCGVLLVGVLLRRRPGIQWMLLAVIGSGAFAVGWLISWALSDIGNIYGLSLPVAVHRWVGVSAAGIAIGLFTAFERGALRRVIAILLIVITPVLAASQINLVYGQFTTVRTLFGISSFPPIDTSLLRTASFTVPPGSTLADSWSAPADMPSAGTVYSVDIPGTTSGFVGRAATVYLPPAALTAHPPALPVVVALSGQPGSPDDWFLAGHLTTILNHVAAKNNGLAPIVISPDQLGSNFANPMCLNTDMGNVATYVTVDVRDWVIANLPAASAPNDWTLTGFSSGATCAVQLGAANPTLFGQMVPVATELAPSSGSAQNTIDVGFGGDRSAYEASALTAIIAAHAPSTQAIIGGAGANDPVFTKYTQAVVTAGQDAGMDATFVSSPGTGHDWYTVKYVFTQALSTILTRGGITQ